jgi:hypothetical protein
MKSILKLNIGWILIQKLIRSRLIKLNNCYKIILNPSLKRYTKLKMITILWDKPLMQEILSSHLKIIQIEDIRRLMCNKFL